MDDDFFLSLTQFTNSPMSITVRKGSIEDLPEILNLVQHLADYEDESESVQIGIVEYQKRFLENQYDLIVAETKENIIGMALYYPIFSTWKGKMIYLEDFIVHENFRGVGAGQLIFDMLISESKSLGASGLRWQVLRWNEPALRFYRKYGSQFNAEWLNGRLDF